MLPVNIWAIVFFYSIPLEHLICYCVIHVKTATTKMHSVLVISTLTMLADSNSPHTLSEYPFFQSADTVCIRCSIRISIHAQTLYKQFLDVCLCLINVCLSCCWTPLSQFQYYYFVCPFILSWYSVEEFS